MLAIGAALSAGAAYIIFRKKGSPKFCYVQTVAYDENFQCPAGAVQVGNQCYNPPKIADGSNTCVDMTAYCLPSSHVLNIPVSPGILNPPYVDINGSSVVNVGNQLTCVCASRGPFPVGSANDLTNQKCVIMDCFVENYTGELFVEISGGRGAPFSYQNTLGQTVTNIGGAPGIVYGTLSVQPGDTIRVAYGYDAVAAQPADIVNAVQPPVPGGGGAGSLLGGSNGGGATAVYKLVAGRNQIVSPVNGVCPAGFDSVTVGTSTKCYKSGTIDVSGPLLVAGGGGGASTNAFGGDAGSANVPGALSFMEVPSLNPLGVVGGPINVTDPAVLAALPHRKEVFGISGGGGTQQSGGQSLDPLGTGSVLSGGSGTPSLSSGAGGGSGYFGGGAGFTNGLARPANIQGAGGGGSSFVGPAGSVFYTSSFSVYPVNRSVSFPGYFPTSSYVVFGLPAVNA
jgi:hypothetical protein